MSHPAGQHMYTTQPGVTVSAQAMVPSQMAGVPPGLEYLALIDTIMVNQVLQVIEILSDFEARNKYALKNVNGEQVYFAAEESSCCERNCCGSNRSFTIHIVDNYKKEVIRVRRPFKCFGGCFGGCCAGVPCFGQECTVECPPGNVVGHVAQRMSCCSTNFSVKDVHGSDVFKIDGPCSCMLRGCQDKEFAISLMGGEVVGAITKKWGGCCREVFTDADVFSVSFPIDLDVRLKAVLVGATFLIDFMEFEKPNKKDENPAN